MMSLLIPSIDTSTSPKCMMSRVAGYTTYQRIGQKLLQLARYSIALVSERVGDPAPEAYRPPDPGVTRRDPLNWCLIMTLLSTLGLLGVAYGFTLSRQSGADVSLLLFPGLLLIFAPTAGRLLLPVTTRGERLYLICLLGLNCYLIKVLASPLYFSLFDEFLHTLTANNIASSQHLYSDNSLLPVSAYYPGLEIVTNAFSTLSGLNVFYAGIVMIGIARLIMMLALFLLYEQLLKSQRAASIATLVYVTNPHFLIFDAEFSYESLAFPLAMLILVVLVPYQGIGAQLKDWLLCRAVTPLEREVGRHLRTDLVRIVGLAWFIIVALIFTHHITSYFLDGLLALWASVYVWMRLSPIQKAGLVWTALFAIAITILCIFRPGNPIIAYLSSFVRSTAGEFEHMLVGSGGARQLFVSYNDQPTPLWQRGLTISSFLIVLGCLPFGLLCLWRQRTNALVRVFGIIAFLYPFIQVFRFTNTGSELTDRVAAFLFLPLSYVLALFFVHFWPLQRLRRYHMLLITTLLTIMLWGGVILGAGPHLAVFPGPYQVIADSHSIEVQGIESAQWTRTHLAPHSRIATDRINQILQAVYGDQYIVSTLASGLDPSPIFLDQSFGPNDITLLQKAHIRYLVVDMRLTHALPLIGFYYEQAESGAYRHLRPVNKQALEKFRSLPGIETVFDSGDITIYNMRGVVNEAQKQ